MQVVPVWSAVLDPCVLRARIATGEANASCRFDAPARRARSIPGTNGEHIAFDCLGEVARIDLIGERLPAEPVLLSFEIIADERLGSQLAALQRIYFHAGAGGQANRLRRQHLSLLAADARAAGANLRDVAELVLGRVRQCGVELGVASGLHFQAALGVICSGCASSIIGVARAAMPSICM